MIWMGNDLSLYKWLRDLSEGNTPSAWHGQLVKVDWCAWADARPACGSCLSWCILKRARLGRGWSPWKHSSLTSLTSWDWDALRRRLLSSASDVPSLFPSLLFSLFWTVLSAFLIGQLSRRVRFPIAASIWRTHKCPSVCKGARGSHQNVIFVCGVVFLFLVDLLNGNYANIVAHKWSLSWFIRTRNTSLGFEFSLCWLKNP